MELILPHASSSDPLAGPIVLRTLRFGNTFCGRYVQLLVTRERGEVRDEGSVGQVVNEKFEQRRVGVRPSFSNSRTLSSSWASCETLKNDASVFVPKTRKRVIYEAAVGYYANTLPPDRIKPLDCDMRCKLLLTLMVLLSVYCSCCCESNWTAVVPGKRSLRNGEGNDELRSGGDGVSPHEAFKA